MVDNLHKYDNLRLKETDKVQSYSTIPYFSNKNNGKQIRNKKIFHNKKINQSSNYLIIRRSRIKRFTSKINFIQNAGESKNFKEISNIPVSVSPIPRDEIIKTKFNG
tara:strand:- start:1262 stop:1582 length:321 start_codon:yes stop_codon:yes gene_type:complete